MISLSKVKQNFFMQFVALLIFILLIPVGIYSQPREIIFDGTGSLTRDIVKAKLAAENLQLNEEWSATIRGYTEIATNTFRPEEASGIFQLFNNIVSVNIESGCEKIGMQAFYDINLLTIVNIQSNLKVIETQAFSRDSALVNIILPETMTKIGPSALANCVNLELSELPSGLTVLDPSAFYSCKKISISEIPKGITSIGISCFQHCENITEITFYENITEIKTYAFQNCKNLKKITCLTDAVPNLFPAALTQQHPDKRLYVKKEMRDDFLAPNGMCAQTGRSCWTYSPHSGLTEDMILPLPDGIEVIISANDENLGDIEIETSADMDNLQVDDILILTATPNDTGCHRFICWKDETTGEIISKRKTITYTVKSATKLVAIFE